MKLGLRGKLGILMLCLYLASVCGLIISFIHYSPSQQEDFEMEQERFSEWIGKIVHEGSPYFYDDNVFKSYLSRQAEENDLIMMLLDHEGEEIWRTGRPGNGFRISAYNTIMGSEVLYRVKTQLYVPYHELFLEVGQRFPLAMFIFFLFITLSFSIFLNNLVVRPLMTLARRMNQYAPSGIRTEEKNSSGQCNEIELLESSFEDMVERIESLTREQQDMLGAISHDLNTPLTTIAGYTERLLSGRIQGEEKRRQAYRIINRKTQNIADISKQLADIADVVERGWMNDVQVVDAYTLFNELFAPYQEEWSSIDCKVLLRNELPPGVQLTVNVHSLCRVIANIMENALRYGELPLVTEGHVLRESDCIVLNIEDNGPGVPQEALPFLFERFYRLDSSRSDSGSSRGLGLYICREIIRAHGGQIKSYLVAGGGLGTSLTLPVCRI